MWGDCGGGYLGSWKELDVSINKSYFSHAVLRESAAFIYVFDTNYPCFMLNVRKTQHQKVCLASELFSHTTSTELRKYSTLNCAEATADFNKFINSWFDLINTFSTNIYQEYF
ncbi:hypothetical protein PR048_014622 [Dryococelus australis]|uniref:Uncharacterized protein n=1 Tax=Dryococelus australis TaxID=614101 RepID=A0ABQ9HER4_9NEOP|nr:hypothetical protein PR048_014622 [Dryococelus australis]